MNDFEKYTIFTLLFGFSIALIDPVLGPYIKSLGLSNTYTSIVFSVLPLSIIIILPILGQISDKIGRKSIIQIALATEIIAFSLYLFDKYIILIIIARFLSAISASVLPLIALAKIEDIIKDKRGQKSGVFLSVKYVGTLIAPLVGGVLADFFYMKFPFIVGITIMSLLFLALITVKEKEKEKRESKINLSDFNLLSDIKVFLSHKDLRAMALLGICAHAVSPFAVLFLPIYISENLGLSATFIGIALFIQGFTHLFQGYFGQLADRIGSARAIIIGLMINAVMLCLIFLTKSYLALVILLFIRGTGLAIWNVSAWTLMSDIGERIKKEGLIVTSYLSIAKIGALISFLISGIIVDMYSIKYLVFLYGIIIIAASMISILIFNKKYLYGVKQQA